MKSWTYCNISSSLRGVPSEPGLIYMNSTVTSESLRAADDAWHSTVVFLDGGNPSATTDNRARGGCSGAT